MRATIDWDQEQQKVARTTKGRYTSGTGLRMSGLSPAGLTRWRITQVAMRSRRGWLSRKAATLNCYRGVKAPLLERGTPAEDAGESNEVIHPDPAPAGRSA